MSIIILSITLFAFVAVVRRIALSAVADFFCDFLSFYNGMSSTVAAIYSLQASPLHQLAGAFLIIFTRYGFT